METICITDGQPQHLEWHQRRVDATLFHFYPAHHHTWELRTCIEVSDEYRSGKVRCRIDYNAHHFSIQFGMYEPLRIENLKLTPVPSNYDYAFKYADRSAIESWFESKGTADDILMTKNGWITDTSIANIAFRKGERWYTPAISLLAGTTWKRLVSAGTLIPRPIHQQEIGNFEAFKLFNAMNAFENATSHPIRNIN